VKALGLRFSVSVLFALVGIFLGLFATARPLNNPTIRGFNDARDHQHGLFPRIQIQPVASGFALPVTVTNAGDGTRCNQLGGARPQAAPNRIAGS
jgi:hypothetical protein